MKASIIIPTYNGSNYLPRLLGKLKAQTFKCNEIIVIDSSSTDGSVEAAKSTGAKTFTIPKEEFDHGKTRNLGALKARGDILIFMTQDAMPADNHALENLIKPLHKHKDIAASYGRQLPNAEASPFSAHLRAFNYPESSYTRSLKDKSTFGFKTIFFSNSFSAYKRDAWEKIGRFKEHLIFGEDTHAAAKLLRSGYRIAYAADALVHHSHNYSVSQEFKRYFDVGVFHNTENWIVKEFGKTEGEGKKYIKSEAAYLLKEKKPGLFPVFIMRNAMKYCGYSLGLRHSIIPAGLAKKFSMNRPWWEGR